MGFICKEKTNSLKDMKSNCIIRQSIRHLEGMFRNFLKYDACSKYFYSVRLFYLYQDSVHKYVTEECFFACLSWLYSACSGLYTAMMIGEICLNFNESQTSFLWYSSCSKIPFLWEEEAWSYVMQSVTIITILFITLGCNILIYAPGRKR